MANWVLRQEAISRWQARSVNRIGVGVMVRYRGRSSNSIKVRISWRLRKEGRRWRITKDRLESKESYLIPCKTEETQAIRPINNIFQSDLVMRGLHLALYKVVKSKDQGVVLPVIQQIPFEMRRAAVAIQTMLPWSKTRHNFIRVARTWS